MIGRLALAASDPDLLAEAVAGCDPARLAGPPGCHADLAAVTGAALVDALGTVHPRHRAAAPVVLAVSGPAVAVASRFAARCLETTRRLRPSDSVRMEIADLVRAAGAAVGWHGPAYLIASVGADGRQALLAATALRARHPAVLVGELLAEPDPTGGTAGPYGTAPGVLAVVASWEPAVTGHPAADGGGGGVRSAADGTGGRSGPRGSVLLPLAGHLVESLPMSEVGQS
ncbi:hypothetical protein O7627_16085 [Solwaraspora sp. WMMD1047]|uniref:hypothetical protein n=1 Tax=Solwaraspora sp. WMMD1047 TaxID=3016102 RepID=UPI00241782FA|nr:hypothetical protein [Solwaraspora sp. WMMD1047]MDG4830816.1 hypothetical protein [Solwaraspora sp. WMMD1047]